MPMNRRRAMAATVLPLAPMLGHAQQDRPPLRVLVGFPPGGSADTMARILAERLPAHLGGQAVVVDNKPGAAGRIAIEQLKNAPPDGQTVIVMPSGPVVLFPHVFRKLSYDPQKDLAPISQLAHLQFCLVSGPQSNVRNMAEFAAKAKAEPQSASYGSSGNGTVPHFLGLMIGEAAGVPMTHIPYQGGAPALSALLGGHIGYTLDVVTEALEHHRSGKVRIIAVAGARRSPQIPDVPTLREQGVPLDAGAWFAMYGPGGLPREHQLRLSNAVQAALREKAVADRLNGLGLEPVGSSPQQLAAVQRADLAMWQKPVQQSGFKAD